MPERTDSGYNITAILEGMREEYWQALREAEEPPQEMLECIVFNLGGELFACEMAYASEVIKVPKLVKVPRTEGIFAGAFNLRGEILLAVDIRPLLALPSPPLTKSARILVVKSQKFKTGLITDMVYEVTELSYNSFTPLPEETNASRAAFVRGQLCANSNYLNLLDIQQLLNSPEIVINQNRLEELGGSSATGADNVT